MSPPEPRISVVIPAYNHERFIGQSIASLQAQTLADFEVVIVDDGSRDATAEICAAAAEADQRIRLVRQANGGSHAAINRGIAEAGGDWIAILNSDDCFAPQRLARLREQALDGARFVTTACRLIDGEGEEITDPDHWWWASVRPFHAKAVELGPVQGLLFGNYTVSTSNFFFQRSLFDEVGPMRPLRYVIDWEWALRAALHAPQATRYLADERLLDYRLHGSNTILGGALRGACEVNRMHRELFERFGTPAPLVTAMFRNQRLVRRNWRAAGEARGEHFVRAREADVATLREALDTTERFLRDREADVVTLRTALDAAEQRLRERENDVRSLHAMLSAHDAAFRHAYRTPPEPGTMPPPGPVPMRRRLARALRELLGRRPR